MRVRWLGLCALTTRAHVGELRFYKPRSGSKKNFFKKNRPTAHESWYFVKGAKAIYGKGKSSINDAGITGSKWNKINKPHIIHTSYHTKN